MLEKNIRIICSCFAMAMCLAVCPAPGKAAEKEQAESFRQIITAESNGIRCYASAEFCVIERDAEDGAGTDFLIKHKATAGETPPCTYVSGKDDFEIKNEWAEYFAGLKGHLLILDSATGPGPSGLIIWDLKRRKKVFEGSWSDPVIRDDSILYWTETGEATPDQCPKLAEWESHGLGGAIETRVLLNLSDFSISRTKETRCMPRQ